MPPLDTLPPRARDTVPPGPCGTRSGVTHHRVGWSRRLNTWRKNSPFSAYWLSARALKGSVAELAPHARGLMLDVGVGERPYAQLFRHVDRYIGIEYPPVLSDKEPAFWDILERVRKAVDVFADAARLPFADESLDTVLATEVLEHLTEPARSLAEMARVLRPGGRLLLTVPFCEPLHFLPQDYWRFTPSSLRLMAEAAGLEIEAIRPRGNTTLSTACALSQWLLRTFAAARRQADGSIVPSSWRHALAAPLFAVVQCAGAALARVGRDDSMPLGYSIVLAKPELKRSRRSSAP